MRLFQKLFLILFIGYSFAACCTDRAAQVRSERPVTLGLLGAGFRPNGNVGLELDASLPIAFTATYQTPGDASSRHFTATGRAYEGKFLFFPWATSAFHLGAGYETAKNEISFDANIAGDPTNHTNVKYTESDQFLTIPVGWYWIWENGFTFNLDLGPRLRLSQTKSTSSASNVDTSDRDKVIDAAEAKTVSLGGLGVIGYSF